MAFESLKRRQGEWCNLDYIVDPDKYEDVVKPKQSIIGTLADVDETGVIIEVQLHSSNKQYGCWPVFIPFHAITTIAFDPIPREEDGS